MASSSKAIVGLGNEREVLDLVANSVMSLWEVVNDLTRLRPTRRERRRVTIFGSARVLEDHWVYAAVRTMSPRNSPASGTTLSLEAGRG
ncbi:MAG: hypothetical protein J2P48_08855 [Alphaproteobacteria bacterium]|nr:hypothetical protein [Alphaproteobacteria bacterium]